MRHAKSSWKTDAQTDHERPLNARGRADAPRMARTLQSAGWVPELALVSDAARTEETWAWMSAELTPTPRHIPCSPLYHGRIEQIRRCVREHVREESTVLLLGHNPGWEDAVEALTGRFETLRTANVVLMSHPEAWPVAMDRSDWELHDVLRPR